MEPKNLMEMPQSDGGTCSKPRYYSTSDEEDNPKNVIVEREIPTVRGRPESFEYAMNYPKRGKCYIFNQEHFKGKKKLRRWGTANDANGLKDLFTELGFEVIRYDDLPVSEVMEKLDQAANDKETYEHSCLVCCILSHGFNGILQAYDGMYPIDKVFTPFRGDNCKGLRGKPKLFFIQACQGGERDSGVAVAYADSSDDLRLDHEDVTRIPVAADFLVAYSTIPNYVSWREGNGSWFIQALLPVLKQHADSMDLLQILTIVIRTVATENETPGSKDPLLHKKKQSPYFTSTLTKLVKLCAS